MNILIIGEYSSFSKNLKHGLKLLGHKVVVVNYSDGWKKIGNTDEEDCSLPYTLNFSFLGKTIRKTWVLNVPYYFVKFQKFIHNNIGYFDAVLIINYCFIRSSNISLLPKFSFKQVIRVLKNKSNIFLSACGDDIITINYSSNLRYTHIQDYHFKEIDNKANLINLKNILVKIKGVIPVMYEYAISYRNSILNTAKVFTTIPLPIYVNDFPFYNVIKDKIVIFHGLNRPEKGTEFIIQALKRIELKYSGKVEIVIDGKLPYTKYMSLLKRANVVIDQCRSHSYGMNALIAMAMGKLVLSGNEPECRMEFNCNEIPIVNILPDVNDIESKLEYFIINKEEILQRGIRARKFVEDMHEAKLVAMKYVECFQS